MQDDRLKELMNAFLPEDSEAAKEMLENFDILMMRYNSAIREVRTKLEMCIRDRIKTAGRSDDDMSIKSNIEYINELKAKAAEKSGRTGDDVLLVAVTKLHSPEEMNEVIDAGITDIGERCV